MFLTLKSWWLSNPSSQGDSFKTYSAGNGVTTSSQTKELTTLLRSSVSLCAGLTLFIGVPADIVPATFKKKRPTVGAARVKGEEGDDKPGRPEEGSRPAGMGRGARWEKNHYWIIRRESNIFWELVTLPINSKIFYTISLNIKYILNFKYLLNLN